MWCRFAGSGHCTVNSTINWIVWCDCSNNMTTSEVHWIGGGEVTEAQLRFLVGSSGANDMLREELSRLQQPLAHQENINNIVGASEVHLISDEEAADDQVVLDEVVDSVAGQLSKQASSLLSNETIACNYQSIVEESTSTTIPVPNFTVVHKSLHFALQWSEVEVDRLTSPFDKKRLMSREDHADLCGSIEGIHDYLQKTIKSSNIKKCASGLEKLLNGGHITNDQAKAYKKQYNIG